MGFIIILLILVAIIGIFVAFKIGKRSKRPEEIEFHINVQTTARSEYGEGSLNEESSDSDAWEGSFWEASDPKRLRAHLQIEYQDGNGSKSTRAVKIREFDNKLSGGILMGHCELRNATRTFRFDRIRQCVDLETGDLVENIGSYLNDLYSNSPERSAEILAEDYIDVLKTLYFVAKADGQIRREEKAVISEYVRKLVRDERITTDMIDEVLSEIGVPTFQAFKVALGRVLKSGQVDPNLLVSCCREIVATQSSVHAMEKEALDYIDKKLSSLPAN
ncbi:MAG: hypothetical protein ABIP78_00130 [Pyrinomonadaceae bacterium]